VLGEHGGALGVDEREAPGLLGDLGPQRARFDGRGLRE